MRQRKYFYRLLEDNENVPSHQYWAAENALKTSARMLGNNVALASIGWMRQESCRIGTLTWEPQYITLPHAIDGITVDCRPQGHGIKIYIAAGLTAARTAEVVAHELRHVKQMLDHGAPSVAAAGAADRREFEREADLFAYAALAKPSTMTNTLKFLDWSSAARQREIERRMKSSS